VRGTLALAACLALAPRVARADGDTLAEAEAAYGALELERAASLVESFLAAAPAPAARARALVLRALLRYQASEIEEGRADLAAALDADASVPLPAFAPPAVRDAFGELVRARSSPEAPSPSARPSPPRTAAPARARHRVATPHPPAPRRQRALTSRPWFWTVAGAGVAGLAAGGGAILALSNRAEIEDHPHQADELSTLTTRFETGRTIAVVGAVVGAGLLAVTALLLYLDPQHD
jgi:hypothetical protein